MKLKNLFDFSKVEVSERKPQKVVNLEDEVQSYLRLLETEESVELNLGGIS
jgi:hypothetical protein